ncbi:MAG: hypothetical protein AAFY58_02945, partial [Planctomycetota bacterium]
FALLSQDFFRTYLSTGGGNVGSITNFENAPGSVTWNHIDAGDIDGDGNAEIAFSGAFSDVSGFDAGRVFVALSSQLAAADAADGTSDGTIVLGATPPTGVISFEGDAGDIAGYSVTPTGDLSGDGKGELLIGEKGTLHIVTSEFLGTQSGGVALSLSALASDPAVSGIETLTSPGDGSFAQVARSAGDVDGNGTDDLLITIDDVERTPNTPGRVQLVFGEGITAAIAGQPYTGPTSYTFTGDDTEEGIGWWLNGIGDVDGDGLGDLLVAAPDGPGGGVVAVLRVRAVLGDRGCAAAVPNSSGAVAHVELTGSDALVSDDLTLVGSQLPAVAFVLPLASLDVASLPVGGGTLCLGGSIVRLNGLLGRSSLAGTVVAPLQVPQWPALYGVLPQASERWYFQLWFRDVVGGAATSNFSDTSAVTLR